MKNITTPTYVGRETQGNDLPDFKGYPLNWLGCKQDILENIAALIDDNVLTIADPFGGTGIVSWYFKSIGRGYNTLTGDVLRYSHLCHKVLIANNDITLSANEIEMLLSQNPNKGDYFQRHFWRAFGIDTCILLDNWTRNISRLNNPVKRDIAIFLPIACLRKKIGHFQTSFTSAGTIAFADPEDFVGLDKSIWLYATTVFPKLLINNGADCKVFNEDAVKLLPKIQADVLYLDTPYSGSVKYEKAYSLMEKLVQILSGNAEQITDLCDYKGDLNPYTMFDSRKSSVGGSFHSLFQASKHFPYTIISYNTSSDVTVEELKSIAKCHWRSVEIKDKIEMLLPRNKKVNHEILMVCR